MGPLSFSVYIVDDDNDFKESLKQLVKTMGYKVFAYSSAELFLKENSFQRPACLLLDIFMANGDGFALQKELANKGIFLPIIFITGHGDVPMSVKAMKRGAVDFLLKPFKVNELRLAIDNAIDRDIQNLKREVQQQKILARIKTLTPREQEVMRQVITGKLNKQIAVTLGIAEKTIRKHRGVMMKKMRVLSVAELVRTLEIIGISINLCDF